MILGDSGRRWLAVLLSQSQLTSCTGKIRALTNLLPAFERSDSSWEPVSCFLHFTIFFCFSLSLVVISRVKLNFPFSYPGQHHLNKQTEHRGLRHVYRGSWQTSKAKHEGGPATLSRQTSYCFWARRQALHPLTCTWFTNNGVLSNWCFLSINGNRSTRHEDKATRRELSISEGSDPSFQWLGRNI